MHIIQTILAPWIVTGRWDCTRSTRMSLVPATLGNETLETHAGMHGTGHTHWICRQATPCSAGSGGCTEGRTSLNSTTASVAHRIVRASGDLVTPVYGGRWLSYLLFGGDRVVIIWTEGYPFSSTTGTHTHTHTHTHMLEIDILGRIPIHSTTPPSRQGKAG
jgi:hypothetical protein